MGFVRCWRPTNESAERSYARPLQQALELLSIAALQEEAVGIVALGQRDSASVYALLAEPAGKRLRRLLTTAIRIIVKSQIDGSRGVAELPKLARIEMGLRPAIK
jgi:hypothetical protein